MSTATLLKQFHGFKTALLSTYRHDGTTCVNTPVSIVIDGDHVLFRTWSDSGKAKRLSRNPVADLRPCTFRGEACGTPVHGDVRLLDGGAAQRAARLLSHRHPVLQRWAVPLSHRLMRYRTLHYEFVPSTGIGDIESMEGCPD